MWDACAVYLVHSVLLSIPTEEVTVQENLLVSRQSLIIIQKMRLLGWFDPASPRRFDIVDLRVGVRCGSTLDSPSLSRVLSTLLVI